MPLQQEELQSLLSTQEARPVYAWQKNTVWTRQPGKTLCLVYFVFTSGLLGVFFFFYYIIFSRPRASWTLVEAIQVRLQHRLQWIVYYTQDPLISRDPEVEVDSATLLDSSFIWIEPAPNNLVRDILESDHAQPARIPGYLFPKHVQLGQTAEDSTIALFFHGGGYYLLSAHPDCQTGDLSRALLAIPCISAVLALEYRLSSHTPYPAQLLDALAAYTRLVRFHKIDTKRIILVGDSAGANLALGLTRYLIATQVMDLPGGLMLLSPWCDVARDVKECQSGEDFGRQDPPSIDYLNGPALSVLQRQALAGSRNRMESITLWTSPYLSHVARPTPSGTPPEPSFLGFPRTFITYGDAEALLPEIERLESQMSLDGVDVTTHCTIDGVHDIMILPWWNAKAKTDLLAAASRWLSER